MRGEDRRSRFTRGVAPGVAGFMLRTSRGPLKAVWALGHRVAMHGIASWIRRRQPESAVYVKGTFASGEPVYGISDIDLVVVAPGDPARPGRMRERVQEQWRRLCRLAPPLSLLVRHFWVYEEADLAQASVPSLTYGLVAPPRRGPAQGGIADDLGIRYRPGLYGIRTEWRLLRGPDRRPPEGVDSAQDRRIDAWLELQHWWRYAFKASAKPEMRHVPYLCVKLLAEPVRILLWAERGERVGTREEALRRGISEFPEEEPSFRLGLELLRALPRSPAVPLEEVVPALVRLTRRMALHLADVAGATETTDLRLRWDGELVPSGVPRDEPLLPLADWRARVFSELPDEVFTLVPGDPTHPEVLASAARADEAGVSQALVAQDLLILPTLRWNRGTARAIQCAVTDPVSLALIAGERVARFPDMTGWSARDSARRAVAEHAARLGAMPGGDPVLGLGLLFTAARAALFAESLADGDPELALTVAATAQSLAERDGSVRATAQDAYESFATARRGGVPPSPGLLLAFGEVVRGLPAYTDGLSTRVHTERIAS